MDMHASSAASPQASSDDGRVGVECSLWALDKGAFGTIIGFEPAMPDGYCSRLTEMGFHIGESVTCLLRPPFGCPRVYRVSNTVYSLEKDLAASIRVAADG